MSGNAARAHKLRLMGAPPEAVRAATAEAARELFEGHKYVFVMHEDQGAPHVHLSVRAPGTMECACRLARPTWIGGAQCSPGTRRTEG